MGTKYGKADLDPSQWRYLGSFYVGPSDDIARMYRDDWKELYANLEELHLEFDIDVKYHANGGCASCGASFSHGQVYIGPDAIPIAVGHICGGDYFGMSSVAPMRTRAAVKYAEANKGRKLWEETLANDPDLAAAIKWGIELIEAHTLHAEPRLTLQRDMFIGDVERKARKYGSISERQREAVIEAHQRGLEREAREATQAAKLAEAGPLIEGKRTIEGTIISTKYVDNNFSYYGEQILKMLVELDNGNRVFGTVPSALKMSTEGDQKVYVTPEDMKGKRVQFNAEVQKSHDDEHFGFFKRPTKAEYPTTYRVRGWVLPSKDKSS